MVTQSDALDTRPRHRTKPENHAAGNPVQLTFLSLTGLICLGLNLLVLVTMTAARTGAVPQLPDLPPAYLPGSLLPADFPCYAYSSTYGPRCSVNVGGHQVYFDFDAQTHIIANVVIPVLEFTVGDLILSWGTPSGMIQTQTTSYIYWDTRTVSLYTGSPRPDSQVVFILYEMEPRQVSSWRGFRRHD